MFDSNDKDKQGELFSDLSGIGKKQKKLNLNLGKIALSLSYENLIVLSIAVIMVLIVCYSLGVERGKYLVRRETENSEGIKQAGVSKVPKKKSPPKGRKSKPPTTFAKSFFPESDDSTVTAPSLPAAPRVEVRLEVPAEMPAAVPVPEPKPKPKPKPKPVKTAQSASKYTIQVATFGTGASAKKEMARLKKKGYRPFVINGLNRRGKFSKICVGSYESISDAAGDLKKLKKIYGDCFVRNR
jgi:cell division septation protein DedD